MRNQEPVMEQTEIVRRITVACSLAQAVAVVCEGTPPWQPIQDALINKLAALGWRVVSLRFAEGDAVITVRAKGKWRTRDTRISSASEFRRVLRALDDGPTLLIVENPERLIDPDLQPFDSAEHAMRAAWQCANALCLLWVFEHRKAYQALLHDYARPFYSSAYLVDIS